MNTIIRVTKRRWPVLVLIAALSGVVGQAVGAHTQLRRPHANKASDRSAATVRTASASPTPMALSSVDTLALNAAAANGDANPTTINSILTTRGNAYQAIWSGAGAPVDPESVYAITMHGSFNDSQWHPPGVATRNYGFFTIVVDAATGTPVDANLRASSVDIGVLGQLTQLPSLNQGVLTGEIRTSVAKQARTCHGPKCDNTRVAAVSHGRVSASQRVGADGTFRLVVPDGAYSVRAGHGCAARYAHVSHTKTVHLMIRCR